MSNFNKILEILNTLELDYRAIFYYWYKDNPDKKFSFETKDCLVNELRNMSEVDYQNLIFEIKYSDDMYQSYDFKFNLNDYEILDKTKLTDEELFKNTKNDKYVIYNKLSGGPNEEYHFLIMKDGKIKVAVKIFSDDVEEVNEDVIVEGNCTSSKNIELLSKFLRADKICNGGIFKQGIERNYLKRY
ncbi:hypothetical protein ACWOBW_09060 [Gemella sanguinis]|jgi:hypothetical protein